MEETRKAMVDFRDGEELKLVDAEGNAASLTFEDKKDQFKFKAAFPVRLNESRLDQLHVTVQVNEGGREGGKAGSCHLFSPQHYVVFPRSPCA